MKLNMVVVLILQGLAAFSAAASFAVIFRVPQKRLVHAGIAGAIAWTVYAITLRLGMGRFTAGFAGAAVASLLAEWAARRLRVPVTLLVVPAIIPLVPGFDAYSAMLSFLHGDTPQGIDTAVVAVLVALSIAAGVVAAATIYRMSRLPGKL